MSERLSDERIEALTRHMDGVNSTTAVSLASEVQESRRLIADLLALHHPTEPPEPPFTIIWCAHDDLAYPCPTVRRIEQGQ